MRVYVMECGFGGYAAYPFSAYRDIYDFARRMLEVQGGNPDDAEFYELSIDEIRDYIDWESMAQAIEDLLGRRPSEIKILRAITYEGDNPDTFYLVECF